MVIAGVLLQALVLGLVATLLWALVEGGPWAVRPLVARWLALSLLAWGAMAGPLVLGG